MKKKDFKLVNIKFNNNVKTFVEHLTIRVDENQREIPRINGITYNERVGPKLVKAFEAFEVPFLQVFGLDEIPGLEMTGIQIAGAGTDKLVVIIKGKIAVAGGGKRPLDTGRIVLTNETYGCETEILDLYKKLNGECYELVENNVLEQLEIPPPPEGND